VPREYPVVLAWQMRKMEQAEPPQTRGLFQNMLLPILMIIAIGLLFLRRLSRQSRQLSQERAEHRPYRSLRRQAEEADGAGAEGPVDPELKAAAEAYLKDKAPQDGPPDKPEPR
jgi:hypothetical protein